MVKKIERPSLVVIIRHAESARNVAKKGNIFLPSTGDLEAVKIIKGIPDHKIPITDEGRRQALLTGIEIKKLFGEFDVVYDSGYERTKETREKILSAYSPEEIARIKLRQSYLIREREPGYTYDMTTEEAEKNFPWLKEFFKEFGYFYSRPPGGESQADVCERVYQFIGTLFAQRAGKKVLIVTHGGTLRALRFNLEKWTPEDYEKKMIDDEPPANCGVTVYRYSEKTRRLELEEYNKIYWS